MVVKRLTSLNTRHGGSSACLVKDGALAAAAEEERLRRIKRWAGSYGYRPGRSAHQALARARA